MTNYDEILNTIELYKQGWKGRTELFREAFHKDALIYFIDAKNKQHHYLLENCFESWASTNWELNFKILAVDIIGDIATVKLIFQNISFPDSSYIDIHSLMRMNGRWKIVNKLASHFTI